MYSVIIFLVVLLEISFSSGGLYNLKETSAISFTFTFLESAASFSLRTRSNPSNKKFVSPLNKNDVNVAKPVKFIVHGWKNAGNESDWDDMTGALLKAGDYNVIVVDWSKLAAQNYPEAARDTSRVGK